VTSRGNNFVLNYFPENQLTKFRAVYTVTVNITCTPTVKPWNVKRVTFCYYSKIRGGGIHDSVPPVQYW